MTRCAFLVFLVLLAVPCRADSVVLILGGVPGSAEHEIRFSQWSAATRTAMIETFRFPEENVLVRENFEARGDDIRSAFSELSGRLTPDDTFFLIFIGHGSFDGTEYKFNTMGPDLAAAEYDDLLSSLDAGRMVIVNATNSSGASIEEFSGENRVVVAATRTGTERNDTIFYDYFLEALTDARSDEDKNERLSVWEAFRYASLAVERFYETENRLATEHAQISDNGTEKTGADPDELPALARLIEFNVRPQREVDDPVLRSLLAERDRFEADINALRLIGDTMAQEDYEAEMEALLIELALKNQEIRARENEGTGAAVAEPAEPMTDGPDRGNP